MKIGLFYIPKDSLEYHSEMCDLSEAEILEGPGVLNRYYKKIHDDNGIYRDKNYTGRVSLYNHQIFVICDKYFNTKELNSKIIDDFEIPQNAIIVWDYR